MFLTLSAQITQEQANEIVLQYIQNEVSPPYVLYVNTHVPTAEGIVINTFKEETVKVKYPCWSYYLNENPSVSAPCPKNAPQAACPKLFYIMRYYRACQHTS